MITILSSIIWFHSFVFTTWFLFTEHYVNLHGRSLERHVTAHRTKKRSVQEGYTSWKRCKFHAFPIRSSLIYQDGRRINIHTGYRALDRRHPVAIRLDWGDFLRATWNQKLVSCPTRSNHNIWDRRYSGPRYSWTVTYWDVLILSNYSLYLQPIGWTVSKCVVIRFVLSFLYERSRDFMISCSSWQPTILECTFMCVSYFPISFSWFGICRLFRPSSSFDSHLWHFSRRLLLFLGQSHPFCSSIPMRLPGNYVAH